MIGWKPRAVVEAEFPGFLASRGHNSWSRASNAEGDLDIHSAFGRVEIRVAVGPDGSPMFDRPVIIDVPGDVTFIWAVIDGVYHVVNVIEERPFPNHPDGQVSDSAIVFGQAGVMGIREKLFGKEGLEFLAAAKASIAQEAKEEAGVDAAGIETLEYLGLINANPAYAGGWDHAWALRVNPQYLVEHSEVAISQVGLVPMMQFFEWVGAGEVNGVRYRNGQLNHALFIWLCRHPEAMTSR